MDTKELICKINARSKTIRNSATDLLLLMQDCGIGKLTAESVTVKVQHLRASAGGEDFLMMGVDNGYDYIDVAINTKPSSTRETDYLYGDFSCGYNHPSREDLLIFAKALPDLIAKIEAMADN